MKRKYLFSLIIISVLLITSFAFAFAYIGKPTRSGSTTANMTIKNISNGLTMAYSGSTSLSLSISLDNLSSATAKDDYSSYVSNSVSMAVKLTSSGDFTKGAKCNYVIKYTPTTKYNWTSNAKSKNLKELVVAGSGPASFEYNIGDLSSATNVYSGSISTTNTTTVTQNWTIAMKFYNLNVDQAAALKQSPSGKITIEPTGCVANL